MGDYQHHAIIVVGSTDEIAVAHQYVYDLHISGGLGTATVSSICPAMNDTCSFMVAPDGGKEGGLRSQEVDDLRARIRSYLEETRLTWVEVTFGELTPARIVHHPNGAPNAGPLYARGHSEPVWSKVPATEAWVDELYALGITSAYSGMESFDIHSEKEAAARLGWLQFKLLTQKGSEADKHEYASLQKALDLQKYEKITL